MYNPNETFDLVADFATNIVAGSAGVSLNFTSTNPLTGYVMQLAIRTPAGIRTEYPLTIAPDGLSAFYDTVDGQEIKLPGEYEFMAQIQVAAGPPATWTNATVVRQFIHPAI